jgi:hypothetical protein
LARPELPESRSDMTPPQTTPQVEVRYHLRRLLQQNAQ